MGSKSSTMEKPAAESISAPALSMAWKESEST